MNNKKIKIKIKASRSICVRLKVISQYISIGRKGVGSIVFYVGFVDYNRENSGACCFGMGVL